MEQQAFLPIPSPRQPVRWQDAAGCIGYYPEGFFSPDGERGKARERREQAAKVICAACTVQAECLEWALGHGELGVWGNTTEAERREILRRGGSRIRSRVAS